MLASILQRGHLSVLNAQPERFLNHRVKVLIRIAWSARRASTPTVSPPQGAKIVLQGRHRPTLEPLLRLSASRARPASILLREQVNAFRVPASPSLVLAPRLAPAMLDITRLGPTSVRPAQRPPFRQMARNH